ncbi:DsbC family protein [Hydrogenophaga sp. IBVHS1]|jgi:thiol:disulfide interchange protein DsbC|uniref:DsbC family protein n=1 Tax=unclassified Hydrogenophaga TaxID=2610897 RepID=UPI000A2DBECB|nr:DsbC family protein [Hydrogenophaga sp. IBVHS1]OSZ73249.1 disulfide isomerase [Hydrogenophaga sp. IBVHS1]
MKLFRTLLLAALAALSLGALAQEAAIRKALVERLPNLPNIEEVTKTPVPGIWEVRLAGNRLLYSDNSGNYIFQGALIDARNRVNLTEARIGQLTAIDFKDLPLKDAFKLVKGKGTRQMAVFEDPNCSYCKRLHRELAKIDDLTIHVFLIPVLGDDSVEKTQRIWCAKDKSKTYAGWMLNNQPPEPASCDIAAIERNSKLASEHGISGTPTLFFTNDKRVPGFITADRIEAMLKEAKP